MRVGSPQGPVSTSDGPPGNGAGAPDVPGRAAARIEEAKRRSGELVIPLDAGEGGAGVNELLQRAGKGGGGGIKREASEAQGARGGGGGGGRKSKVRAAVKLISKPPVHGFAGWVQTSGNGS